MLLPRGLGLYFLRVPDTSPADLADALARRGIRWVALGAAWHDEDDTKLLNPPAALARFAEALKGAGVAPHLWGYPWHDRVDRFVSDMHACTSPDVAGWLLDPELGFKGEPEALASLVKGARDAFDRGPIGLTSYGNTKVGFPFQAASGVDYGSPQLYTVDADGVRSGLSGWQALGLPALIPSFGLYTKTPQGNRKKSATELEAHLGSFLRSDATVRAMIGWSYKWVDDTHWPVLKKYSDALVSSAEVPG